MALDFNPPGGGPLGLALRPVRRAAGEEFESAGGAAAVLGGARCHDAAAAQVGAQLEIPTAKMGKKRRSELELNGMEQKWMNIFS